MNAKNKGEYTCETYLDLVDDFRDDEECWYPNQMSVSGEYLDSIQLQPMTVAPSSTFPIRERLED